MTEMEQKPDSKTLVVENHITGKESNRAAQSFVHGLTKGNQQNDADSNIFLDNKASQKMVH